MDFTEETKNPLVKFWQKSRQNKLIIIAIGLFIFFTISGLLLPQGQKSFKEGNDSGKKVGQTSTQSSSTLPIPLPSVSSIPLTIETFCPTHQLIVKSFADLGFIFSEERDSTDELEYKGVSKEKNVVLAFQWGKPKDIRIDPSDVEITARSVKTYDVNSQYVIDFKKFLEIVGPSNGEAKWLDENVKKLLESSENTPSASLEKDYKNISLIKSGDMLSLSVSPLEGSPDCPSNFKKFYSYKELDSYKKGDTIWKSIVILPDTPRILLTDLGKQIHKKDPTAKYHIFDDDTQFEVFKAWDVHYPDEENYPFPEDWTKKHYIAIINRMGYGIGDLRWQLYFQIPGGNRFHTPGNLAVDLE